MRLRRQIRVSPKGGIPVGLVLMLRGTLVASLVPGLIGTRTLFDHAERHGIEFADGAVMDPMAVEAKATLAGPPRAFAL